ncbi:MAG: glycoside hydrolase family 11 protein [Ruminococcus sp.]|uniref:glycoside hydrolase family 11 protein n=1 Tax=Ruminococcus sp. TaxID=41978 RepID=UPI0025CD2E88|nr:glycoside hydrolase family 11 protein [Ruminococcus sp.]MCR4796511.1 glycoside hydrolase family 11 protein [Ruminococcus sp.]
MKFKTAKTVLGIAVSTAIIASSIPFTASAIDQMVKGYIDGYDYEMWNMNSQGTIDYVPAAGAFTCSWNSIENFIANVGRNYDNNRKNYKEISNLSFSYDLDFTPLGDAFYGAYGWTRNPLVEWYIVDGWGSRRPRPLSDSQMLGTTIVNGHEYEVFKTNRYNQPSISGPSTFCQYWSIRTTSGSKENTDNHVKDYIDVAKHFDSWNALGLDVTGSIYEVVFNIEGYRSNGSAELKRLRFGEGHDSKRLNVYDNKYSEEGHSLYREKGCFFMYSFNSFLDEWEPRGTESIEKSDISYEGPSSMLVTQRLKPWEGPSKNLNNINFFPDNTYSLGAFVMQDSEESVDFELVLQYLDSNGRFQYDIIAEAKSESQKWTELSNYSYTIPKDASQIKIFIDTPDYTGDFYVDNAYGGQEYVNPSSLSDDVPFIRHYGDINRDGAVDIFDLPLLRKAILMTSCRDYIPPTNSDVNNDGKVDIADLVSLQKYLLGGKDTIEPEITTTAVTTVTTTNTTAASTSAAVSETTSAASNTTTAESNTTETTSTTTAEKTTAKSTVSAAAATVTTAAAKEK